MKKMTDQNKKIFIAVAVLAVLIIAGALMGFFTPGDRSNDQSVNKAPFEVVNSASFSCREGKTISAQFGKSMAHIVLSDGRVMTLPQGISASGARYVNDNETFVFWNSGVNAFIQENAKITFVDCKTSI